MKKNRGELIVALDVDSFAQARKLVDVLKESVDIFKVGSQLFTACGPSIIRFLLARNKKVFLDLKFHDIPNTVGNAVRSAVNLSLAIGEDGDNKDIKFEQGLLMLTIHTVGGEAMMKAAVKAAKEQAKIIGVNRPLIVGITVLTSEEKTANTGKIVLARARLAKKCGLDGIVASSQEAKFLRKALGANFVIVTPGIRPLGTDANDQERITTPTEAVLNGSDYLVVGRPIVKAENPSEVADQIIEEIFQVRKKSRQ